MAQLGAMVECLDKDEVWLGVMVKPLVSALSLSVFYPCLKIVDILFVK
jgi:hypothetical protein